MQYIFHLPLKHRVAMTMITCCYQCEIIAYSSDAVLERSFLRSLLDLNESLRRHIRVYVLPSKLPIRNKQLVTTALDRIA